jgi:Tol biopolymer transport system component
MFLLKRKDFLKFISAVFVLLSCVNVSWAAGKIPAIVSVFPEYGQTDVSTLSEIRISFSSRMNNKEVTKSFAIFPPIKGKFNWDENTLVFTPAKPLLPSTSYFVSFTPDVKSKDGIPLSLTYFSTPAEAVYVGKSGNINIISISGDVKEIPIQGFHPVWASDNTSLIYDYQGEIWMVDTNGKNNQKLVEKDPTYDAAFPKDNPLKDQIAFIGSNAAGCDNVYIVDKKTRIIRQLTSFFEPENIKYLSWSADGLYLAFLRTGQIWIMNQDGKDLRRLTTDDLVCSGNFAWSPGGTKIAFSGDNNVWIGDIYSLEIKKMSFDNPDTGLLDWSENNKIVFESEGVTVMNADGSDEMQIPTAAKKPVWINEGNVFSLVLPLHNEEKTAQLWLMSHDGKNKEKIADIDDESAEISWSRNIGYWNLFSP